MTDLPKSAGFVTLRVSADAWRVLEQTLRMDARSHAFDPTLRAQIAAALCQVEEVHCIKTVVPLVTTNDLEAVVDDLLNERPCDPEGRAYSRSQIEHALASWLGQLSETLLENLAQYARDGFRQPPMKLPPHSDLDLAEDARGERADRACERYRERAIA